jgi:hypothetical protein
MALNHGAHGTIKDENALFKIGQKARYGIRVRSHFAVQGIYKR